MQTAQGSGIRVLMFGWEFPPFNSGGLGVACLGLAKGLVQQGVALTFVLPKQFGINASDLRIISADIDSIKIRHIDTALFGYVTPYSYEQKLTRTSSKGMIYASSLMEEVMRYAQKAKEIALSEQFDVVHAHDWLSFPAGLAASGVKHKPMIAHVHATEFDRTGGLSINQDVYDIERKGMKSAHRIIAVSNFTKHILATHYGVDGSKVDVVHNGIDGFDQSIDEGNIIRLKKDHRIVLFVGRLTLQKGPDYFLRAAKKVLERRADVIFVIAGSGEMKERLINDAVHLGISDKVFFTGFLRGNELKKIYQSADLFVMPSVSEPFGITCLEALAHGAPVIISKQSGVSEAISHALKVDFWDVDEMSNKILSVLEYGSLRKTLKENGSLEVKKMTWKEAARKTIGVYREVLNDYKFSI